MRFDLLGPPTVWKDDREKGDRKVDIGGPTHQLVLAILLSDLRFISTESLIDHVWPADDPDITVPAAPRPRVHEVMADLRRDLQAGDGPEACLPRERNGYRAAVRREQVDLLRFHDLLQTAQACQEAGDLEDAVKSYREAFLVWGAESGPPAAEPFAGLSGRWVRNQRDHLRTRYLTGLVACIDLELRLGRHRQLVPELVSLHAAVPFDEQIARLLMLAHYRSGQTAESLATFTGIRERLAEELATEPGTLLRDLHRMILQQDPALRVPEDPAAPYASDSQPHRTEGRNMNEYFTNNMKVSRSGRGYQVSKLVGDVHVGTSGEKSELADQVKRFRKAVRSARRAGELRDSTATTVEGEIVRVLTADASAQRSDEIVAVLTHIRRLIDDAPKLVDQADELIHLASRGDR